MLCCVLFLFCFFFVLFVFVLCLLPNVARFSGLDGPIIIGPSGFPNVYLEIM